MTYEARTVVTLASSSASTIARHVTYFAAGVAVYMILIQRLANLRQLFIPCPLIIAASPVAAGASAGAAATAAATRAGALRA